MGRPTFCQVDSHALRRLTLTHHDTSHLGTGPAKLLPLPRVGEAASLYEDSRCHAGILRSDPEVVWLCGADLR